MLVSVLHPKSQWHTRRAYFEQIRPILLGFAIVRADRVKEYGIIWVSKDDYEHFWYLGLILRVFSALFGILRGSSNTFLRVGSVNCSYISEIYSEERR